ncbi:putative ubiquitin fusion degradation protein [Venturia nashicola]|uniref:Putative ubiquitin fusion degradation protein n=1 Tax=Venturia nashicola TaxID=86259 RepID=A0A4Z1NXP1_9PEZI|nr:putative ubiquitin fusion degradation protein [Venturia nashicola]
MAPRTRTKNLSAEHTYASKTALKQKRLPARRRTVTHKSKRPTLEKRQSTLTQIADFGRLPSLDDIDGISDEDEFEGERPPRKRRRTSKTKSESRRDRTLTQMDFVKTPRRTMPVEDSEEEGTLSDDEEIVNEEIHLTPHSETSGLNLRRPPRKILEIADSTESLVTLGSMSAGKSTVDEESSGEQAISTIANDDTGVHARAILPPGIPQTPKRVRLLTIPSSQTPPTTPLSTQRSPTCPGSGKDRSPLQARSTNLPIMKDSLEEVAEPIPEVPTSRSPFVPEFKSAVRETQPIDSPTKERARNFRAQMDALRNGGALQQLRRKTRTFERGQIVRPSTNVLLVSETGEKESRNTRSKNGETQFSIGEETQAILGGIDLSGEMAQEPVYEQEIVEDEADDDESNLEVDAGVNKEDQGHPIDGPIADDENQNTIFEIGEPQEVLENEPEDDTLVLQYIRPREPSPELPYDNYGGEERVPSSQNETPRGTRRTAYEATTQSRHITFSDHIDTLTLPIPQSPTSTAPPEGDIDTQESVDAASAQLIYESQAYAALAASSPIEAEPMPIPTSSPAATRHSSQPRFRTPRVPRKSIQVEFAEEDRTQAPSTSRTESISTTPDTYPKSALKGGRRESPIRSPQVEHIPSSPFPQGGNRSSQPHQIPSSPSQRQQQFRSEPTTPGIFRFLRGPVTTSQLIPDSLRSDLDDGIGLPPRWTQDEEDDDDDEL